ncbi:MAG TPA: prolyl oligopeptidase family serine peptidase [Bryobacteraceae bacterium]|nr:prolyl oligopeptidase family serine peptidase [Bryobacteraceae bacterium]
MQHKLFRVALAALFVFSVSAQTAKRPINHHDYDSWRAITGQKLSNDGKFMAYGLFPQSGDGEVLIRNLVTGQETRFPAGMRPTPAPSATPEEEPAAPPRGATIDFAADSRTVVFNTFPLKADSEKAKKDKKPAPRDGMTIVDLATGKSLKVDRVRRFAMPEDAGGYLAYQKEGPENANNSSDTPRENGLNDQQGGRGGRGGRGGAGGGARLQFGTDLILRTIADGNERTFSDVAEFSLSKDGKQLVYAVSAHDTSKNGLFVVNLTGGDPSALLAGKGKFLKITWDEPQKQLVFLSDRDDQSSKPAKLKMYRWDRQGATATELVSSATPGFRKEFVISENGNITFSKDGSQVYFGAALPQPDKKDDPNAPLVEKAVVEVWSSKDDFIQPIQKVTAGRDRNRSFTAAVSIKSGKVTQIADDTMENATPSENAQYFVGVDNREYRRAQDYGPHDSDVYLFDNATGTRKLLAKKVHGQYTWSPSGKFLLAFDGKDWNAVSVPDGKITNLTSGLQVKFWNEEDDHPDTPPAYGSAGWTEDGKYVLLYDHNDVWRVAPDGSGAKNITAGYGRAHNLRFRYVREDTDTRERWIDSKKPLLLHAENLDTFDTGFFRASIEGTEPKQLIMSAKNLSLPVKAKNADVYLLTEQDFSEFPDLVTTDGAFKELRKVSHANPQQDNLMWGASEVVHYKNADGVALSAALYKPANFDPKKKYPMMVYIYEKLTQNVKHFVPPAPGTNINISYYVSNGYLVLTPDIVYTVGYPGQSALKCVLPAIQSQVDRGIVDENAIGIQGHSWGGYQVAYMVTQTKRFKAVEAGAPVADMISAYDGIRWGTGLPRQFQYERTQSRIGGSLWEYPTRFIENSPIFWADRVSTPVMILQNDGDTAVPWYQGIEFFLALRRLGKEAYMFNYNGQPHGLQDRPDQKDYTIRMQQYFDHYLKGAPAPDWMQKGVPYLDRDRTALSTLGPGQ